jgi:hypothetical protein
MSSSLHRYPFNSKMQADYIHRLETCKRSPAYSILSPIGEIHCTSYPLMEDDNKGWRTVKRCMTTCRRKRCRDCERGVSRMYRIRSDSELEEEANIDNWDEIEHYGRVTYTTGPVQEHNGALFDIGSRF